MANYPFCTIEPNVGVIEVPDERLPVLAKIVNTQKIVPAVVEFYDIAGLVRGASTGEGLGNKFLSHIREVAAIVHVCRLFEDSNVTHVSDKIDPVSDITTIEAELMLADLATLDKQKEPKGDGASKEAKEAWVILSKVRENLNKGIPVRSQALVDEEKEAIKQLNLLTSKPAIYVFNVSENQLQDSGATRKKIQEILNQVQNENAGYIFLCAKMEADIVAFNPDEQKEYLGQFGLEETGLNRLIKKAYETLGLISFLTAGTLEARAWTITRGMTAPQAAGVIHTDFEKHFIKADIIPYHKFVEAPGWVAAREKGLVTMAGRDYIMQDGDVVEFKVNA